MRTWKMRIGKGFEPHSYILTGKTDSKVIIVLHVYYVPHLSFRNWLSVLLYLNVLHIRTGILLNPHGFNPTG